MDKPSVLSLSLSETAKNGAFPAEYTQDAASSLVCHRIRTQVIARGLARHYGDCAKPKEGHQKARSTRLQRQLAIIEKYSREKAREEERLKAAQERMLKCSQSSSNVILPQKAPSFPRKISLRHLPPSTPTISRNQTDGEEPADTRFSSSDDTTPFLELIHSANTSKEGPSISQVTHGGKKRRVSDVSVFMRPPHKSTMQVLCELKIMKDIMLREQLVAQVHDGVIAITNLTNDILSQSAKISKSDNAGTSPPSLKTRISSNRQVTSSSKASVRPDDKTSINERSQGVEATIIDSRRNVQQRMTQLSRLISSLQLTTLDIVEAILHWRAQREQGRAISNVEKVHRFPWKKKGIANYLIHLGSDLHDVFPSPAMDILLGESTKYNPLLLSRATLDQLGIPDDTFVSTIFLTERRAPLSPTDSSGVDRGTPSPTRRQTYSTLQAAVKGVEVGVMKTSLPPYIDHDRARKCLEAIRQEIELEAAAAARSESEQLRLFSAYNPFETIKQAGGVENAMDIVLKREAPEDIAALTEKLRRRQEDTSRLKLSADEDSTTIEIGVERPQVQRLQVNPRRMRLLIEQRKEAREAAIDCELHDISSTRSSNKLKGQLMVRKMNVRRLENQYARKIQRQYQVYRRRTALLKNLSLFVSLTRERAVSIQKTVRGFLAKQKYLKAKMAHDAEKRRHDAARLIWYSYKRYKRRLRHRHSMSVEAVAQIQLLHVIQQHIDSTSRGDEFGSAAERYRRSGEERRKQRAVQLQKRRQELLELEAKRVAAATRIQSIIRMHAAKLHAAGLRGEHRAHLSAVSAMMIQSKIRKFLKRQEKRRERFRNDLERVNRSAVRIQSIYRGYNSRASLIVQLDERMKTFALETHEEDDSDEEDEGDADELDERQERVSVSHTVLPLLTNTRPASSRARPLEDEAEDDDSLEHLHAVLSRKASAVAVSSPKLTLPAIRSRAQSVESPSTITRKAQPPPPVRRQTSSGTVKVELKLKEPTLGDDFDAASHSNGSIGMVGQLRRRISQTGSTSGSYAI